ncbi:MAG: xanthine dehydrogenase family protein [Myxococcales bacterium]|nr:xanthine dehydrogenase family protein [Myxococcales bacterium]
MHIGRDIVRIDGHAKVTGAARYVDDVRPDDCLYAATVRSTIAHGRIVSIDQDPAFDWSDVTLATAKDVPGENVVALMTDDQPVLADGVVRHVAEPVALVAAPTRDKALAAVRHVRVTYAPLDPLFDPEASEGSATRIFGEDNVFSRITIDHGDARGALAAGGTVIEGTYRVGLQEQLYIEPQGMIAIPRADGGMTLFGSMQCPYYIVKALTRVLGHDKLNVVQAATGGGFGGKEEYPSMVAAHAATLAVKTGKPVKLIYRRDEDLRATTKRHPAIMHYRTAVDPDTGKLLAADIRLLFDGGAYNTLSPVVLSRGVIHAMGPYACPNVRVEGRMVATHTPPNGAFRGFGAPQVMFAAERHMDRIARTLGRDPLELRRINLYRDGDVTPTGQRLHDVGGAEVVERAMAACEAPLPPSMHGTRPGGGGSAGRRAPGRGVAIAWHGCGFTGNGEAALKGKADVALEGDRVVVYTASTDIGQGTDTIFPSIVADVLGIDVERVRNADHDTGLVPDSGPTVASRTAMVVGQVVKRGAEKLLDALRAEVGGGPDDSFDALRAKRKTDAPLRVQSQYEDQGAIWDATTYQGEAYPTYGWSCVVVDLDVDLDTGEVLYRRLVQATDVGKALNPVLCSGQLEGGALQGLGYATCEEVVLDDQHGMINNRLTNYIIPTSLDAPEMVTELVEIPFEFGPFGAKGIGEIPHDVPAAAVAQAIEAAAGVVLDVLPMTPERVMTALEAKGPGRDA